MPTEKLHRATNSFTQRIRLTAGLGEAYAINNATLCSPSAASVAACGLFAGCAALHRMGLTQEG